MKTNALKILMLEDSDADAEMIQRMLKKSEMNCEFKVMMTRAAFEVSLQEFNPDVILSDNAMPQFSASEALDVVKQHAIHIPFILVTGTVSEEFAASIIKAGADDYLLKDRLTRLPAAIETALKQKQTIKEKREASEKLVQSEKRFRALVENNEGIIALVDGNLNTIFRSSSATRITGWTNAEFSKVDTRDYIHSDDIEKMQHVMKKALANPAQPIPYSVRVKHKNGHYIWLEGVLNNMIHDPVVGGIISNMRDVTERVQAEQKIAKANRLYFFISQINQMIVRTTDAATLFAEVCKIAVEVGKFRMAWIGMIDEQTKKVIPVMHCGEESGYLTIIKPVSIDDIPEGRGPTGTALREAKYVICNDIENDESMVPWKEEALARGYYSSMSLPVKKFGKVAGSISVYAAEKNFFDAEEIALLEEATGDVSFALEVFEKENQRQKAEAAVIKSEQRYHTLTDISPVGIFHTDAAGSTTYVNPRWCKISGLTFEEGLDYGWLDAVYEEDKIELKKGWQKATGVQEFSTSEYRFVRPDGSIAWVLGQATPERNAANEVVGYVGTITDITGRKKAEDVLRESEETFSKIFYLNPSVCAINDLQDNKFTDVNEAFIEYFGFTKDEVIGKTSAELGILKTDVRNNIISKMDEHGIVHNIETIVTTKYGENKDALLSTSNIYINKKEYAYTVLNDITERKKAEEAIKASEEQYRTLVEQATDGIFIADSTGKFIIVNTSGCRLSGYTAEELKELTIYNLVDPQSLISNPFHFEEMHQPQGARAERIMVCKDGTLVDVEISAKFLSDKRFIAFVRDIGDRLKAAQAIRISEERYRVLVEEASEGIFISDPSGRFTTVNASACKIAQYTEEELLQMSIYDFFIQDDIEQTPLQFEALKQGKTVISERMMKRRDGEINHLEITSKLLTDGRLLSLVRDVAERKKAEQALLESEEKYRSLVEQASDAIFIADTDGKFITVNSSACKLSGRTEEELMHMNIFDFTIEEDIRKQAFRFEELKQGKTTVTERVMRGLNGDPVHVEVTSKFLSNGRLLSFVRDISERIKAQNEIIKEKNLSDSIINSLPASFFMINSEGKMLRWNKHLERATKYSSEEIAVMQPLDFFVAGQHPMLIEKITSVFLTGEDSMEAMVELKTKEKVPYYFKGISLEYDGMPCIMGVGIDISERVKAQEEIKFTNEKLRELTTHLLNVREEERKRIGREIHDELGQQLTAIKMDVSWIDKKTPDETELIKNKLRNIITLLDGSNQSIRRILSELRPGILDDNGLLEALEWLNRQFTAQTGIPVEFKTKETELKLLEPVATCIFRVYQETFTNITRYANASKVAASLTINNSTICVTVKDNGEGFDMSAVQNKKSFGILGMKERILSLNGNFQLISHPGKGTKIIIVLPVLI